MKFYEVRYPSTQPPGNAVYPCAVLTTDNWDDMGYQTTWGVNIYRTPEERIFQSSVKILQLNPEDATKAKACSEIESVFDSLDESYCSLGPDLEYYEKLKAAGPEIYKDYLSALRDVVFLPAIVSKFEATEGFRKSLLRFSEAEKAFREAASLFSNAIVKPGFQFTFQCRVVGAINDHKVSFDFSDHPTGLNRTALIIGRNGTGKTQFLAKLAGALSGWSSNENDRYGFSPERPSFSKIIAVSYSVFDDFTRPPEDSRTYSYKYCGIRSPDTTQQPTNEGAVTPREDEAGARFLSPAQLKQRLLKAREIIRVQEREGRWKDTLLILLEGTIELSEEALENLDFYDGLSSGQRILVAIMTEIIAHISKQSVILFDEPELHLHPEVLAALARALDHLLKEFDSYAIIATHGRRRGFRLAAERRRPAAAR